MYLKHGSLYVTNDLDNLPVRDLQVGDHIILLEMERSVNMVLHEKLFDNLLHFRCSTQKAEFEERDEFDPATQEFVNVVRYDGDIRTSTHNRYYLILKDGKAVIQIPNRKDTSEKESSIRPIFYKVSSEKYNYSDGWERFAHNLHRALTMDMSYRVDYGKGNVDLGTYTFDDSNGAVYLRLSLDDGSDVVIMLNVRHYHDMYVRQNLELFYVHKNGHVIHFDDADVSPEFAQDTIQLWRGLYKVISENHLDAFLKYVRFTGTPREEIMKNGKDYELRHMMKEICGEQMASQLLDPFYKNEEKDVEAYADIFRTGIVIKKGMKIYSGRSLESNLIDIYLSGPYVDPTEKETLKTEHRKAKSVYKFLREGKNGINPYDGKVYRHGVVVSDDAIDPKHYYVSPLGIRWTDSPYRDPEYYVPLEGMYVLAEKEDKDVVKRIDDQYGVYARLAD